MNLTYFRIFSPENCKQRLRGEIVPGLAKTLQISTAAFSPCARRAEKLQGLPGMRNTPSQIIPDLVQTQSWYYMNPVVTKRHQTTYKIKKIFFFPKQTFIFHFSTLRRENSPNSDL